MADDILDAVEQIRSGEGDCLTVDYGLDMSWTGPEADLNRSSRGSRSDHCSPGEVSVDADALNINDDEYEQLTDILGLPADEREDLLEALPPDVISDEQRELIGLLELDESRQVAVSFDAVGDWLGEADSVAELEEKLGLLPEDLIPVNVDRLVEEVNYLPCEDEDSFVGVCREMRDRLDAERDS